jgi:hypothetical protein
MRIDVQGDTWCNKQNQQQNMIPKSMEQELDKQWGSAIQLDR